MLLALRKSPPTGASLWQRFTCWVIRTRLVSQWSHGGIVIDGVLYHSTSSRGLHAVGPGAWTPAHWDLIEVQADHQTAEQMFLHYAGARYDWASLLAFVGLRVRDSKRFYCFEWCWMAITGEVPKTRITPERLLHEQIRKHRESNETV